VMAGMESLLYRGSTAALNYVISFAMI
jgi:hypothetical protein